MVLGGGGHHPTPGGRVTLYRVAAMNVSLASRRAVEFVNGSNMDTFRVTCTL